MIPRGQHFTRPVHQPLILPSQGVCQPGVGQRALLFTGLLNWGEPPIHHRAESGHIKKTDAIHHTTPGHARRFEINDSQLRAVPHQGEPLILFSHPVNDRFGCGQCHFPRRVRVNDCAQLNCGVFDGAFEFAGVAWATSAVSIAPGFAPCWAAR